MQERKFLIITSFLLVLIGAPAVLSVVRDPAEAKAETGLAQVKPPGERQLQRERSPASAQAPPTLTEKSVVRNSIYSRSVVMNYDCRQPVPMEVDGNLLRLKGLDHSCLNEKWTDISITNNSNGFTASVIFLKNGFTTDFIDLNEGDNQLVIQGRDDKGQRISQKLVVKRRSIASVEATK